MNKVAENKGIHPAWFTTPSSALMGGLLTHALSKNPTAMKTLTGAGVGAGVGATAGFAPEIMAKLKQLMADKAEPDAPAKPVNSHGSLQQQQDKVFGPAERARIEGYHAANPQVMDKILAMADKDMADLRRKEGGPARKLNLAKRVGDLDVKSQLNLARNSSARGKKGNPEERLTN